MILLLDIGNTNTHLGWGTSKGVVEQTDIPTRSWYDQSGKTHLKKFTRNTHLEGVVLCSVVPKATILARRLVRKTWNVPCLELTNATLKDIGIDYPKPETIGPDRLANAVSAHHHFGAPCIAVDFGTAVTFDVVNRFGNYIGGIIAPGLEAMTEYLNKKTALLPKIAIREPKSVIGKSTTAAMMVGVVRGYRGLIGTLLRDIRLELAVKRVPVVATGGYASFMAAKLPEITVVQPQLTLEGIRLTWYAHYPLSKSAKQ